jgi:DNA-binding response OmpR family regulator
MKNTTLLKKLSSFVRTRAPRRVLIAEDHSGVRQASAELLRSEGYEVETVGDGERALFKLAFEPFDLLVTDWKMPHLDGVTLVKWLRASGNPVPVVMFSGSDLEGREVNAIRGELAAILKKPALPGRLLATVRAAIGSPDPAPVEAPVSFALQPGNI